MLPDLDCNSLSMTPVTLALSDKITSYGPMEAGAMRCASPIQSRLCFQRATCHFTAERHWNLSFSRPNDLL